MAREAVRGKGGRAHEGKGRERGEEGKFEWKGRGKMVRIGKKEAREGRREEENMGNSNNNQYFLSIDNFR